MEDVKCIVNTSLVNEKSFLREDLFEGQALEILILLLKGEKSTSEIARCLELPIFSARLYLSRLLKANMIKESKAIKDEKTIEKIYALTTTKLDIINSHTKRAFDDDSQAGECKVMADHFNKMTSNAISNIYKYPKESYVIKSSFISASASKMVLFKEKLDALIDEFNDMEEVEEDNTYGLIVNFTPYEIENLN